MKTKITELFGCKYPMQGKSRRQAVWREHHADEPECRRFGTAGH